MSELSDEDEDFNQLEQEDADALEDNFSQNDNAQSDFEKQSQDQGTEDIISQNNSYLQDQEQEDTKEPDNKQENSKMVQCIPFYIHVFQNNYKIKNKVGNIINLAIKSMIKIFKKHDLNKQKDNENQKDNPLVDYNSITEINRHRITKNNKGCTYIFNLKAFAFSKEGIQILINEQFNSLKHNAQIIFNMLELESTQTSWLDTSKYNITSTNNNKQEFKLLGTKPYRQSMVDQTYQYNFNNIQQQHQPIETLFYVLNTQIKPIEQDLDDLQNNANYNNIEYFNLQWNQLFEKNQQRRIVKLITAMLNSNQRGQILIGVKQDTATITGIKISKVQEFERFHEEFTQLVKNLTQPQVIENIMNIRLVETLIYSQEMNEYFIVMKCYIIEINLTNISQQQQNLQSQYPQKVEQPLIAFKNMDKRHTKYYKLCREAVKKVYPYVQIQPDELCLYIPNQISCEHLIEQYELSQIQLMTKQKKNDEKIKQLKLANTCSINMTQDLINACYFQKIKELSMLIDQKKNQEQQQKCQKKQSKQGNK